MTSFSKKYLGLMFAGAMAGSLLATSAQALTWNAPSGAITFDPDYTADPGKATPSTPGTEFNETFNAFSTSALTNYATAGSGGTNAARFAAMNASGTPSVKLTFIDKFSAGGTDMPDIDLFVNGPGALSSGARFTAGATWPQDPAGAGLRWRTADSPGASNLSAFGNTTNPYPQGGNYDGFYGEVKYSSGGTRSTPSFLVTSGSPISLSTTPGFNTNLAGIGNSSTSNFVHRIDGATVSVEVGELIDGTLEFTYTVNGTTYPTFQNPFLVNAGVGNFPFYQLEWRVKGGGEDGNEVYRFLDIQTGGNYTTLLSVPEPASMSLLGLGGLLVFRRRRSV